ncbi:MAG: glycosyltransferase family 39 protein [Pseudomonadota bacterium]
MAKRRQASSGKKSGGKRGGTPPTRRPPAKPAPKAAPKPTARPRAEQGLDEARWLLSGLGLILAVTFLRLGINAFEWLPVHFDEAQYWAYGQELAWGYYSKPPGVGAVIRVTTDLGGDTLFSLRLSSPLAHALIAIGLLTLGKRMFDAQTGFWAAAVYTAAPGVTVSSMIVSTDPVMMVPWVLGMIAWLRASETGHWRDWALLGVFIGLGTLAKYTMLAMPAALIGYALFSARGRDLRGAGIAAAAATVVLAPNLAWNAANGFATVTHVAEDADPGQGYFNIVDFLEFAGAQLGVIGPVIFIAILIAFWRRQDWIGDWRMRMLAWQTGLLLFAMLLLAFLTRAQPNWAAPAYVAGSLFAARWLIMVGAGRMLRLQLGLGAIAGIAAYGMASLYAGGQAETLLRATDPYKKTRIGEPFCSRALAAMQEEGAEVMLSWDRRRLSECMFIGGLSWDEIAVWNPEITAQNHHELVATLQPGDERLMLLAVMGPRDPEVVAGAFEDARLVDEGRFATHRDRDYGFSLWVVQGFRGYP